MDRPTGRSDPTKGTDRPPNDVVRQLQIFLGIVGVIAGPLMCIGSMTVMMGDPAPGPGEPATIHANEILAACLFLGSATAITLACFLLSQAFRKER